MVSNGWNARIAQGVGVIDLWCPAWTALNSGARCITRWVLRRAHSLLNPLITQDAANPNASKSGAPAMAHPVTVIGGDHPYCDTSGGPDVTPHFERARSQRQYAQVISPRWTIDPK